MNVLDLDLVYLTLIAWLWPFKGHVTLIMVTWPWFWSRDLGFGHVTFTALIEVSLKFCLGATVSVIFVHFIDHKPCLGHFCWLFTLIEEFFFKWPKKHCLDLLYGFPKIINSFFIIFCYKKIICFKVLFNQLFSNFFSLWICRTVICSYIESFILIQDLLLKQQNCEKNDMENRVLNFKAPKPYPGCLP